MKITDLLYSDLTYLNVSQDRAYVVIHVVTNENNHYSCRFSNDDKIEPIEFTVNWLDMGMIYDEEREYPTFGELENIVIENDVYTLEGDFGWFAIKAGKLEIKKR